MAEKFQNTYRIPSNRLQGFDYGSNNLYFVTICTKNKIHYFGKIIDTANVETHNYASPINKIETHHTETDNYPSLQVTEIGKIAFDFWQEIPKHYPFVILEEFVIMPNHVHGILFFDRPDKTDWNPNKFGSQSQNLGAVVRGYKSSVKRYANQNEIEFEWQTRFHDHIIRDENERQIIKNYIINNPKNWNRDKFNDNAPRRDA